MARILLHGSLHVTIMEAEGLPNPSRPSSQAPQFLRKVLRSSSLFSIKMLSFHFNSALSN
jgi:hypothetical protein